MAVSCLLISEACSALPWLDTGSQDNSASGGLFRAAACSKQSSMITALGFYSVPARLFTWKVGVCFITLCREIRSKLRSSTCAQ